MQITAASRATRAAPTEGPKRIVPAKLNVSEMEILALVAGSLIESQPLTKVSAARGSHVL
jgi:hypothetical protein